MKAVVYREYGSTDVLQLDEMEKPIPKSDEILIKIHAVEATKSDCEMRAFKFATKWLWLPLRIVLGITKPKRHILGGYFSGEVESLGKNVSHFNKGDHVFGCAGLQFGCYSEYVAIPDSSTVVPKPTNINFEAAAAIPLGGLNALHFLNKANVRRGDKVLINGAGGSIGTFGVMIAKEMGAEVTVVDCKHKEEMLRGIGADHFVDFTKEDFTKSGNSYDVIFNMVAGSSYSKCVKMLKPNGRYLLANPRLSDMLRSILSSNNVVSTGSYRITQLEDGNKKFELSFNKDKDNALSGHFILN